MSEKLLNSFIASIVGCLSAIGTVWFLSSDLPDSGIRSETAVTAGTVSPGSTASPAATHGQEIRCVRGRFHVLEADQIQVQEHLVLVDASGQALVELRGGNVYVREGIVTKQLAANETRSQRIRITTDDPARADGKIFGEIAAGPQQGAYLALLSQNGNHSLNLGFDKAETGFIISQNNADRSVVAQSIMPMPKAQAAPMRPTEAVATSQEPVVR